MAETEREEGFREGVEAAAKVAIEATINMVSFHKSGSRMEFAIDNMNALKTEIWTAIRALTPPTDGAEAQANKDYADCFRIARELAKLSPGESLFDWIQARVAEREQRRVGIDYLHVDSPTIIDARLSGKDRI